MVEWIGHPMRLKLILAGLFVKLANHDTNRADSTNFSLAIHPYPSSLQAGPQDYILCLYRTDVSSC